MTILPEEAIVAKACFQFYGHCCKRGAAELAKGNLLLRLLLIASVPAVLAGGPPECHWLVSAIGS